MFVCLYVFSSSGISLVVYVLIPLCIYLFREFVSYYFIVVFLYLLIHRSVDR